MPTPQLIFTSLIILGFSKLKYLMKKITVLVLAFSFISLTSTHAQKRRSRGQEGGLITAGASFLKFSKTTSRTGIIGGQFGYAHPIGEKNSIGANIFYNANTEQGTSVKTNIVTIQPEFRNYFSGEFFNGAYLALNGEYQNQRTAFLNGNYTVNNFGVGLGAGYNLNFTDRISAAFSAGFDYIINNNQNVSQGGSAQSSTQWLVGLGFGFRLD
jgi:hypothetical protein